MAAKKDDYSWIGWAAGVGGLLWLLSRQNAKTSSNGESTALGRRLFQSESADLHGEDTDEFRIPPIVRDTSRTGPDGIRQTPTYPADDIYAAEETQIDGSGEQQYYETDFLGKRYYPLS